MLTTLRDTLMWTVERSGLTATGALVVLHRTRLHSRWELVVAGTVTGSYGPGRGAEARTAFDTACAGRRAA